MSWYSRVLGKLEQKGFLAANKAHKLFINLLLLGIAYEGYSFFREYNDFFIDAREVKARTQSIPLKEEEPLNRVTRGK